MPRHEITRYEVYPDGYDESTIVDKRNWILYVERREQENGEYLWKVSRSPGGGGFVLTRKGKWIYDQRLQLRWTRHSLEDALALADKHVDTAGPMGWTLKQFEDHFRKQDEAKGKS
jgi:hypothetical protein